MLHACCAAGQCRRYLRTLLAGVAGREGDRVVKGLGPVGIGGRDAVGLIQQNTQTIDAPGTLTCGTP